MTMKQDDEALVTVGWLASRLLALQDEVAAAVKTAKAGGASWSQIGDELGVSKQAAWERYGRPDLATVPPLATILGGDELDDGQGDEDAGEER